MSGKDIIGRPLKSIISFEPKPTPLDWASLVVLVASPRLAALGHFDLMGRAKPGHDNSHPGRGL